MTDLEQVWKNTFGDTFPYIVVDSDTLRVAIFRSCPIRLSDYSIKIQQMSVALGKYIRTEVGFTEDSVYMLVSTQGYTDVDPSVVEPIEPQKSTKVRKAKEEGQDA